MSVELARFEIETADDNSGLERALAALGGKVGGGGKIAKAAAILRLPGDYTDGAREKGRAAAESALARFGLLDRAEMVTVIGSEGYAGTFGYLLADVGGTAASAAMTGSKRLAVGVARGTPPADADIDTPGFAATIADIVRRAMRDAGLAPSDVVHVLINTPAPVQGNAGLRGRRARAIASLGAGVAIGEIAAADITASRILTDLTLHTHRTQSFTGPTVRQVEVIVLGNRAGAGGSLIACSTVADDAADPRPLKRMLLAAGLSLDDTGELAEPARVKAMIYKAGARADGRVQGVRTQIFNGQIPPEKHARAAQSGVLAGLLGTPLSFNTFDPIQQCPDGGAVACVIVDVGNG